MDNNINYFDGLIQELDHLLQYMNQHEEEISNFQLSQQQYQHLLVLLDNAFPPVQDMPITNADAAKLVRRMLKIISNIMDVQTANHYFGRRIKQYERFLTQMRQAPVTDSSSSTHGPHGINNASYMNMNPVSNDNMLPVFQQQPVQQVQPALHPMFVLQQAPAAPVFHAGGPQPLLLPQQQHNQQQHNQQQQPLPLPVNQQWQLHQAQQQLQFLQQQQQQQNGSGLTGKYPHDASLLCPACVNKANNNVDNKHVLLRIFNNKCVNCNGSKEDKDN
jgi:hypothetical protein